MRLLVAASYLDSEIDHAGERSIANGTFNLNSHSLLGSLRLILNLDLNRPSNLSSKQANRVRRMMCSALMP